jgi:hypothetical protein
MPSPARSKQKYRFATSSYGTTEPLAHSERLLAANQSKGGFWPVSDLWYLSPTGSFPAWQLHLGLFSYFERIVHVNSEVADGAFELAMTE